MLWYCTNFSNFGSTCKSSQFPASGEVGCTCAENLLNAAIKESEKLDVKVNLPIVVIRESDSSCLSLQPLYPMLPKPQDKVNPPPLPPPLPR